MLMLPPAGPALLAPHFVPEAAAMLAQSGSRRAERPSPEAVALWELERGQRPFDVVEGVAVIPVYGMILPVWQWLGCSYATGCNMLRQQIGQALAAPEIRAIALHVNSGGGLVSGVADLVAWIVAAKAAHGKPIAAIVDDAAYSAAYWIAAAADTIAVPQTGGVGSIGVIAVHWDYSRALAEIGVTPTIITAGSRKADGNPYQPLPEPVQARWAAECEDLRRLFAGSVAANRSAVGVSLSLDAVLASEARTWDGPAGTAEAVAQGYADAVLPPDQALQALIASLT